MRSKPLIRYALLVVTTLMVTFAQEKPGTWTPDTDWGHWRLGQKADLEFLKTNNMTITFGSGAPSFEDVTREEFNRGMEQAKANNRASARQRLHRTPISHEFDPRAFGVEQRRTAKRSDPYAAILARRLERLRGLPGSQAGRRPDNVDHGSAGWQLFLTTAMHPTDRKRRTSSKPGAAPTIRISRV